MALREKFKFRMETITIYSVVRRLFPSYQNTAINSMEKGQSFQQTVLEQLTSKGKKMNPNIFHAFYFKD